MNKSLIKRTLITTTVLFVLLYLFKLYISQGYYSAEMYNKDVEIINVSEQPKIAPVSVEKPKDIPTIIEEISLQNGANPNLMKKIAFCESSYRPEAIGDGGKAKNIFQFHEPTFKEFEKKYGEDLNYNSAYDQAKLASKMIRDGKGYHWTCYNKVLAMK